MSLDSRCALSNLKRALKQKQILQVTGELLGGTSLQVDPTRNKYEVASQLIIHLLMSASAGDETALKCAFQQGVDMNLGEYFCLKWTKV